MVKIQFLLCEIRLYHSQYTQHVHNLARFFMVRFFIFLLEKRCYKIINWGKLINVDGTLGFFLKTAYHIIVSIVLKNISIVQLLSASLHRSHLNKGCTYLYSVHIRCKSWNFKWISVLWKWFWDLRIDKITFETHLLYKWDKCRDGVTFETDIHYYT